MEKRYQKNTNNYNIFLNSFFWQNPNFLLFSFIGKKRIALFRLKVFSHIYFLFFYDDKPTPYRNFIHRHIIIDWHVSYNTEGGVRYEIEWTSEVRSVPDVKFVYTYLLGCIMYISKIQTYNAHSNSHFLSSRSGDFSKKNSYFYFIESENFCGN